MCAWNNALAYFKRNSLVPIYYQLGNLCFGKKNVNLVPRALKSALGTRLKERTTVETTKHQLL